MLPQVNIIRAKNTDFLSLADSSTNPPFNESAGISNVLAQHGDGDKLTIFFAKALISRTASKPIVFDIGANLRTFAIPIVSYIEKLQGIVHAFEPQRIIYYQLCGNTFLNLINNLYAYNFALSNIKKISDIGPLDFNKAWNVGAYSLSESTVNVQPSTEEVEKISFKTTDKFGFGHKVTLIKIDVEGMELEVLQGGQKLIYENNFPTILFEYNNGDIKGPIVLKLLTDMGYRISKYVDSNYRAQHPNFPAEMIK